MFLALLPRTKIDLQELFIVLVKEEVVVLLIPKMNDKEFHSLDYYNNHCFSRHPKQPIYPELSLILQMSDFESKGNPWE
jgi:hypothetical protein